MTTRTFHLARALGWLGERDRSSQPARSPRNVAPWRVLDRDRGITVRVSRRTALATRNAALEGSITARTRLVALVAASTALGTQRVGSAAQLARELARSSSSIRCIRTAYCWLWRASAVFSRLLTLKFYGPHTGVLYGRLRS